MYLFKVQAAIKIEGGCKVLKNFFCGFRKASIRKNNNCGKGTPVSTHKTCVSFNWNYNHFCGWGRSRSPFRKFLTPPPIRAENPIFLWKPTCFFNNFSTDSELSKTYDFEGKDPNNLKSFQIHISAIKWIYEIK